MKHTKDRVIALDYFRGICILMVLLNHSIIFSGPFAYLGGASKLWTSAAEMFLLISGLTLGIVRGEKIKGDFLAVSKKIWRRSASIYMLNIFVVCASLILALYLTSHNLTNNVLGALPANNGLSLLWSILNLSYGIGWASFLALYAIFMIFAPFAMYALRTKHWYLVPLASLSLFCINYSTPASFGYASNFALWQLYFVIGLVLARFRVSIIGWLYQLKSRTFNSFRKTIYITAGAFLAINVLLSFNISPTVAHLADTGWLPVKLQSAYIVLLAHRATFDIVFMNSRTGVLRPAVTLLFLGNAYLLYQQYKSVLLSRSGKFVNGMGRDTLWIFVAQAFAIPIIALLPLPRNIAMSFVLTSFLILLMWSITKRHIVVKSVNAYIGELKTSYNEAKDNYIYGSDSSSS